MDCAEEVAVLRRELGPLVGDEENLGFDLLNGRLTVRAPARLITPERIIEIIAGAGMRAELWSDDGPSTEGVSFWVRHKKTILTSISGVAFALGFTLTATLGGGIAQALSESHALPPSALGAYIISILAGVWIVAPKAWLSTRRLRPDINALMMIAVTGAIIIGAWFEAAAVAFLFAVSLLLESWSVGRARRAVEALLEKAPTNARRIEDDGQERIVPVDTVEIGELILVQPTERIPIDGDVESGTSGVDEAPITGESVPKEKEPGDPVFAGSINGDGTLRIRTTRLAADTTLAKIIRLVTEAQSRRTPTEQWVDRFARIYTPIVILIAAMIFVIPPALFGEAWAVWFYRALVVLVIACPCALVISTPVSVVAALAASASHGVLIKGGAYLEAPAHISAIAFDKTGTLTEGKLRVTDVKPVNVASAEELLNIAAPIEARSTHPLARAIVNYANDRIGETTPVDDVANFPGRGVSAEVDGKRIWIGSPRMLREREAGDTQIEAEINAYSDAGNTVVIVGADDSVLGLIALADAPRQEAKETLDDLRRAGVEHLIMLTGDNRRTADAIARIVGVDEALAELLPEDKVDAVRELKQRFGSIAMIGDGVNDAPALAEATLGIAMGAAGTDAAIETADIVLMNDELDRLAWLIHHARRTLRTIHVNIAFAIAIKLLVFGLTLIGFASLWGAIAADIGASLIVVANGLRLLRQ